MAKKKTTKKKTAKRKSSKKVTKKVTKRVTKRKVTKRRFVNPDATDFDFSGHIYNSRFGDTEQDAWDKFIARRLGKA